MSSEMISAISHLWTMKYKGKTPGEWIMWGIVFIFFGLMIFYSCESFYEKYNLPPDNPVEEMAESLIENQIGLPNGSIDLSPSSDE